MTNIENLSIQFFRKKFISIESTIEIDTSFFKNSLGFSNKNLSSKQINLFSKLLSEAYIDLKIYRSNILSGIQLFNSLKPLVLESLPIELDFLKREFSFVLDIKIVTNNNFSSQDIFTQKKNSSFPKIFPPSLEINQIVSSDSDRVYMRFSILKEILLSNLAQNDIYFDDKAFLLLYLNEDCTQFYNKLINVFKKMLSLHKAKKVMCKVENTILSILHDNLFYIYPNDTEDNRAVLFI